VTTYGTTTGRPAGKAAPDGSLTGWWNPEPWRSTSKFHYVGLDGRALCGRWAYLKGDIEEGKDDHPDNCAACRKKKVARNAKSANAAAWAKVFSTASTAWFGRRSVMTGSQSIVLRLTSRNGGKWRIGMTVTHTKARTRYRATGEVEIKRLPDGLFAAGRVIEDRILPRLAEIAERNEKQNATSPGAKQPGKGSP
jgi:hypothetical protein